MSVKYQPPLKYILERRGACVSGRIWATGKTAREAWETCERGDWLLWACEVQAVSRRLRVQAALEILATVLHLETNDLPARTVALLSKWYAENPDTPEMYEAVCDLRKELDADLSISQPVMRAAWYAEGGVDLVAHWCATAQAESVNDILGIMYDDVYNAAQSAYANIVRKHIAFSDLGELE